MKRKILSSLLVLTMVCTSGTCLNPTNIKAAENTETWIEDSVLQKKKITSPEKWGAVPDKNQYQYQKEELAAFCHFGPNTFNEVEWGEHYGDKEPNEIFKLDNDFAADEYVKTLKDAGFHKLIVTAKHHDGFCIWNSEYTDYDCAEAGYKQGQGDILEEISAACTKYDMDMGLYLSPWDIHDPSYGYKDEQGNPVTDKNQDVKDYNEYYNNQLKEILGNDKYGNDGHFTEVWMDGAKGTGADAQEYDFEKWFKTIQSEEGKEAGFDADCMLFGAEAKTTVRWIGNEDGYANEETWAKSKVDTTKNTIDSNKKGKYYIGFEDGNQWTVPECDARITSGWFWGIEKNTPKNITDLGNMYFNSVGHNSTLLLNVPPNNKGTLDELIKERLLEFGNNVKETFEKDFTKSENVTVKSTEVYENNEQYKAGNVIDGKDETYWTPNKSTQKGSLLVNLGETKEFDVVSIEEAIELGQRIKSFKIEYRNGDNGDWKVFDQGTTVGAKRLSRGGAVKADQLKITVETDSAAPMISEVGVFKASEGFELGTVAPEGIDIIDVRDKNIDDGNGFTFTGKWTDETGPEYINGTNTFADKSSDSFELKFNGTKVYLMGTLDPGHGTADVIIDGKGVKTINTNQNKRKTGEIIFKSEDLTDGAHTLKLQVKNKAIGVEAAYVINNGGIGMLELEDTEFTMNENETKNIKVTRVGGTKGKIQAVMQPNPGSAVQNDAEMDPYPFNMGNGENETMVPVTTFRNYDKSGDKEFSIELQAKTENLLIGFNKRANVTIKDTESASKETLQELIQLCEELKEEWYVTGWDKFDTELKNAKLIMIKDDTTVDEVKSAEVALTDAKNALVEREHYTEDDPFVFPKEGKTTILEGEFSQLINNPEGDSNGNNKYPLEVAKSDWASHGEFVNSLNSNDEMKIPYKVELPGIYKVVLSYRSGHEKNGITWQDDNNNIVFGSVTAGDKRPESTRTQEFNFEVEKAGNGMLILKGVATYNAPQIDKFEITSLEAIPTINKLELKSIIERADQELERENVYTEEIINELKHLVKAGKMALENDTVTQKDVDWLVKEITIAIEELKEISTVDKSQLYSILRKAVQELKMSDKYTEESIKNLQDAVNAGEVILNNVSVTQQEIVNAISTIQTCLDGLQIKDNIDNEQQDGDQHGENKDDGTIVQNNKPSNNQNNSVPKTGDTATMVIGVIACLMFSGVAIVFFLNERKIDTE